ncbi:MAG: hypothetical protein NW226_16920 [Microscillaceae bacterium]|nr:hypothetical protein [Microscillaceae bacterium]
MQILKYVLIVLSVFLHTNNAFAQNFFPDQCVGTWEGMMQIYYQGTLRDSVRVRFTVAPQSENTWKWQTEYLSEKMPLTKNYTLKLKDARQNLYTTDEGNGIELHEYLFGNKLYSVFEVEGILLTSSYELRGAELIFEVTSGKKIPEATTQEVSNFSTLSLQRVILKKVE